MSKELCFISPSIYRYLNTEEGKAAGGAERQQYMIASELNARGYQISMIVGDFGQPEYELINGIHVTKGCPQGIDGLLSTSQQLKSLYRAMKRVDAGIYYVRGAPRLFSVVSLFAKLLGKKLIFCIANDSDVDPEYLDDRYGLLFNRIYRWALKQTHQIITQTEHQHEILKDQFNQESVIIPNAYDLPPENQITAHSEREFVLWVGRSNKEKKKPLRYLELANQLPDIPFVMVAQPSNDGSHHRVVQNKAESIPNLEFVDTVSPDKIHEYYNRATVLVNTSDFEGFPNTYLEAWRYRTPVVALYHTVGDAFETQNISIQSGSLSQLQSDVERLHTDSDLRSQLGKNAREYVKQNYLLSDVVSRYEKVLN